MKIQSEGRRLVRSITVLVIAALSVATWLAPPAQAAFVPVPQAPRSGISFNGTVYAVAMGADVAYVGGDFTSVTGTNGTFARSRLAAINLASVRSRPSALTPTGGCAPSRSTDPRCSWVVTSPRSAGRRGAGWRR